MSARGKAPRRRQRRRENCIYLDGMGLHQCGLPCVGYGGQQSTISLGDGNHSILVTDQRIEVTTRLLTALSLTMNGVLGQVGLIHQVAVHNRELGEARYLGLHLTSDPRYDIVQLVFERIHAAGHHEDAAAPKV